MHIRLYSPAFNYLHIYNSHNVFDLITILKSKSVWKNEFDFLANGYRHFQNLQILVKINLKYVNNALKILYVF